MRRFNPKKKAQLPADVNLDIEKFGYDGRGIARHHGRAVMVEGALPGEHCTVKIEQANSKLWQGVAKEILRESANRIQPSCEHYGMCGGCQQQHISHSAQLELKQQAIIEQLHRQGFKKVALESPVSLNPMNYRHRARFHVSKHGDIGFHSPKGNQVVKVVRCPVLVPELQAAFDVLSSKAPVAGMSQIELVIDDVGSIGLAAVKGSKAGCDALLEWATNDQGWIVGSPLTYQAGQLQAKAYPGDFTQVNRAVNLKMIQRMEEWLRLGKDDILLDLFCGNGNISLAMASTVSSILGFESNQSAIDHARAVAPNNAHYRVANLFTADLQEIVKDADFAPTVAILDPPRAGAERACETISKLKSVNKIGYISCDPATLARDLHVLGCDKWHLRKVALVDMFPQTRHIETMVLLEK
jgi:23S rRNA (uracil1939-C5)-methyltransferase